MAAHIARGSALPIRYSQSSGANFSRLVTDSCPVYQSVVTVNGEVYYEFLPCFLRSSISRTGGGVSRRSTQQEATDGALQRYHTGVWRHQSATDLRIRIHRIPTSVLILHRRPYIHFPLGILQLLAPEMSDRSQTRRNN